MKVGICTRWCWHEATYAAIRIAEAVQQFGGEVTLHSAGKFQKGRHVAKEWDRVIAAGSQQVFTHWARSCDRVIWTHVPLTEQVTWCKRNDIRTGLLALWHELSIADTNTLRQFDAVVAPSWHVQEKLRTDWRVPQVAHIDWDTGAPPIVADAVRDMPYRLLFPCYDESASYLSEPVLEMLTSLLTDSTTLEVTVAYTSSRVSPAVRRKLDKLKRSFGGRLVTVVSLPIAARQALYAKHHLTVWPTIRENLGTVGLHSLAAGTPVAAFDLPPVSEFLKDDQSLLVPCELMEAPCASPAAYGSYQVFAMKVLNGLANGLPTLHPDLPAYLEARRETFNTAWRILLTGS